MAFLTNATLSWFSTPCCDVKYLDEWHHIPVNYFPKKTDTTEWHHDFHEVVIGHDEDGRLFQHAADQLMRYHFYPLDLVEHVSTFSLDERWAEVGDRIVQRIHLLGKGKNGRSLLDVISMTEISETVTESNRCGFTYITVATHVEQGEWGVYIERRPNNDLVLTLRATSRPIPQEPQRNYPFMRALQKRAHQLGIRQFQATVAKLGA